MSESKTICSKCGREILIATAERRNGMCAPCHRNLKRLPEELFAEQVFARIDATIEPFTNYKTALNKLQSLPRGYALCFAFHHVHAEILNGGISQFYSNSTWSLILEAEKAAELAGVLNVAMVLREIVFYYHKKGRSKHARSVPENYFAKLPQAWDKSLKQLEDEFFAIETDANSVILKLCQEQRLFTEEGK